MHPEKPASVFSSESICVICGPRPYIFLNHLNHRSHRWAQMIPDNPFCLETRGFEVQEQGDVEAGDREIAQHLRDMRFVERFHYLGIGDDQAVDNQIRHQGPDGLLAIKKRKCFLLFDGMSSRPQLQNQGSLVEFFIQSRPQFVKHRHRRANNRMAQFPMHTIITRRLMEAILRNEVRTQDDA